jgi:hypothetical protein
MDLRETGRRCELDATGSGRDQGRAVVNTIMNLRIP